MKNKKMRGIPIKRFYWKLQLAMPVIALIYKFGVLDVLKFNLLPFFITSMRINLASPSPFWLSEFYSWF